MGVSGQVTYTEDEIVEEDEEEAEAGESSSPEDSEEGGMMRLACRKLCGMVLDDGTVVPRYGS